MPVIIVAIEGELAEVRGLVAGRKVVIEPTAMDGDALAVIECLVARRQRRSC